MKTIKLAWLFPDTFGLHGDVGNIMALNRIAKMCAIPLQMDRIELTNSFSPMDYDMIYLGAGEIASFEAAKESLLPIKDELLDFIKDGRILFVTGNSVHLFSESITLSNGQMLTMLGFFEGTSLEKKMVYGDDLWVNLPYLGKEHELFGSQIQMADLTTPSHGAPIIYGYGNNGKSRFEGVLMQNSIFTNLLGPLLVLNPWLTRDMLCHLAAIPTPKLNFTWEEKSLTSKKEFTKKKKSTFTVDLP